MSSSVENNSMVPLSTVVNAALVDSYADIGKMQQRSYSWAARGLKKLYAQALPKIKHTVTLPVNKNFHTATLPLDFDYETFVGVVNDRWQKVPLKLNDRLVDRSNIITIEDSNTCAKCNQDKNICDELVITTESNFLVINGATYEEVITKKMYPNGDYYIEKYTPFLDLTSNTVNYPPATKKFIVNFSLKPCGCLDSNESNLSNLQTYCPDIYCNYYASCDNNCNIDYGGYKIFEETGLIQFDSRYPFDKCYVEYYGYIQKRNGQYFVPQVAFETLVEWVSFKAIDGKKNIPNNEKQWRWLRYTTEYGNLQKLIHKISLYEITESILRLPKFDYIYERQEYNWYSNFQPPANLKEMNCNAESSQIITQNTTTIINRGSFFINTKVDGNPGSPVAGQSTFQSDLLIGATDIIIIYLQSQVLMSIKNDFTPDYINGIISIYPNTWAANDSLVIPYHKNT